MSARYKAFCTQVAVPLQAPEALVLAAELEQALCVCLPGAVSRRGGIEVFPPASAVTYADISELCERSVFSPLSKAERVAEAVRLFLSEPLCLTGGNCYELGDRVSAVHATPEMDRVQTLRYRLWRSGWQVVSQSEGLGLRSIAREV